MKILLVDDSKTERKFIADAVAKMGHTTVEAVDGAEAIKQFFKEEPDLVIMDVEMPVMDGYLSVRKIRNLSEGQVWTPIIYLSAHSDDETIFKGISNGGDDFLVKPVSETVLKAKIIAMERISEMHHRIQKVSDQLNLVNKQLTVQVMVDGLTQVSNRRFLDNYLQREWSRAIRESTPISLILLDIDHFKKYNDYYGHQQGDWCLKKIASTIQHNFRRPSDITARYGGEEFSIVLPNTPEKSSPMLAERVRKSVEELNIEHKGINERSLVTISLGAVTQYPKKGDQVEHFISAADKLLYQAKSKGRNRVCHELVRV